MRIYLALTLFGTIALMANDRQPAEPEPVMIEIKDPAMHIYLHDGAINMPCAPIDKCKPGEDFTW